ncbi:hypothetical protein M8542_36980 [Amycolatopsis sp. OK19-0408]|uniref:Uncharacterized protein n=1 Tax=Amycolatopsis iheyensis TaxID=2945988 RepID=A0A9X2SN20_9PSEU|nr:hypothetical protein [Amycolatopsis iheyensis]MCR6488437.1 hypothetical protein [Amycolatopsis iheyensis]
MRTTRSPDSLPASLVAGDPVSVVVADLGDVERRGPRKFADPAAWLVRSALERARPAGPAGGAVGVIGISEVATRQTLLAVAADAALGHSSPRRFVAAGPGTLIGLGCVELGYTGPSLLLTMPEAPGRELAGVLAEDWLTSEPPAADSVAIVSYTVDAPDAHRATCHWVAAGASA